MHHFRAFGLTFEYYYYAFPYFLYPTSNIVLCFSIFLVLAIAFERFLAVCRPYDYRKVLTNEPNIFQFELCWRT
jgi:hypothetical protein